MKLEVGTRVRVVNPYSGGNFADGDIVVIKQIGCDDEPNCYGAISPYDNMLWFLNEDEVSPADCDCCHGDEAVFWKDDNNNAFIDSNGEMLVMVNGEEIKFNVTFCPMCGYRFDT